MTIRDKILKSQLFIYFFVTALSFISYYYNPDLPDNIYSISGEAEKSGVISFYLTSIVTFVGYYIGPWIFAPFIIFSVLYGFLYSKREYILDLFNFMTVGLFTFFCFYLFFPEFIGKGPFYLLKNFDLSIFLLVFITLMAFSLFLFSNFRMSTVESIKKSFFYLSFWKNKILEGRFSGRREFPIVDNSKKSYFAEFSESLIDKKKKFLKYLNAKLVRSNTPEQTDIKIKLDVNQEATKLNSDFMDEFSYKADEPGDMQNSQVIAIEGPRVENELATIPEVPRDNAIKNYKKKKSIENEDKYFQLVTHLSSKKSSFQNSGPDKKYFEDIAVRIQNKLSEFNIDAEVINILKGPVVDTFELKLGTGVKISKIKNASEDLSMALLGAPIRIVYPMIGKDTVGVEVPRNPRDIIYLDEVLSSKEFTSSKMYLPVAMGKNAFGETFVVDLVKMPHMLVAGATGAGKSVFINTLLVSLLLKMSPSKMKLILIDPKQLELALYAKLPHLIMPVVTDAKIASVALLWAVQEMERRYSILKELGVRNIEGFNSKVKEASPDLLAKIHHYYEDEPSDQYELPYLVVIVDEFADLVLTKAGKQIEEYICRLAAKARAAGIHLVLATQRPSVDVITGLIKSNFPTRVSFRVTSAVDSRTILNTIGAEKLLGRGDMLYKHGTNMIRVHSSFVDEEEIEALTDKISEIDANFHPGAMEFLENGGEEQSDPYSFGSHISIPDSSDGDDLYSEAVKIVLETRAASASFLQRRLKIGYNRAARLIEEMESKGIIGPAEGSKRRKILVSEE